MNPENANDTSRREGAEPREPKEPPKPAPRRSLVDEERASWEGMGQQSAVVPTPEENHPARPA